MAKNNIINAHQHFGEIFRITLIRDYQFMISSPSLYNTILSSTTHYLAKNVLYQFLSDWLREGLLLSSGKYWHNHRKIITPAFHFKILVHSILNNKLKSNICISILFSFFQEEYIEVFDRQSRIMVEKLAKKCDGTVIDIVDYVQALSLDIISETAMGTTINAQNNSESEYIKAIDE